MAADRAPAASASSRARLEATKAAAGAGAFVAAGGPLLVLRMGVSWWYPLVAVTLFGSVMAVALATIARYHPFDRFGPANFITTIRAALTSLIAASFSITPPRW